MPVFCIGFAVTFSLQCESAPDAIQACLDLQVSKPKPATASIAPKAASKTAPTVTYSKVDSRNLAPGCDERGDLEAIRQAIRYQLKRCETQVEKFDKETMQLGCRTIKRKEWCLKGNRKLLSLALKSDTVSDFLKRARKKFDWYQSSGSSEASTDGRFQIGDTQFTGYYTPLLKASRTKRGRFHYPIYSKPPELVEIDAASPLNCGLNSQDKPIKWCRKNSDGSFTPYLTRAQIDGGALDGRGLEIAYLEDPLDVAFMMVQGSATLTLENPDGTPGGLLRANFAAKNGRRLQMLGRIIRCDGGQKEDYSSMHGIIDYLRSRPARMKRLMNYDESYVFFRELPEGPLGSEDVPVTALHSFAVDRDLVPPGAPILFEVQKSQPNGSSCPRLTSLALAQDTGGAIKGAHVDWYIGAGEKAAAIASSMNNPGLIYIGVPKGAGKRIKNCEE